MKKKIYGLTTLAFTFLLLAFYFIACREEEKFIPLKIFSIEPATALIGDTIIIRGEGFSPELITNGIFFPGTERTVPFRMSSSELFVAVPEGAMPGPVTVNILNEETSDSPPLNITIPVVTSVTPEQAWVGDTVVIHGENFRPRATENKVRFEPAPSGLTAYIISGSSTELTVVVPPVKETSTIHVLGFEGPEFTANAPFITTIKPQKGVVGDVVTIVGKGLPVDGTALLGTIPASIVAAGSTTREIKVTVPAKAVDGVFHLRYTFGDVAEVVSPQQFEVYPDINDMAPLSGETGVPVTITGTGFSRIASENEVSFNGSVASITEASETQLVAIVPAVFTTGPVSVTVNSRTVDGPAFSLSPPGTPIIYNISPLSGPAGSNIVMNGKNFDAATSGNIVKFGGDVVGTVLTASESQLTVRVPTGAQTGQLSVTKDGKTGFSPQFTVTTSEATPFISTITPSPAERGATLTIKGGNFSTNKNDIVVNTPQGSQLTVASATDKEITVTVPAEFPAGRKDIRVNQFNRVSNSVPVFIEGHPVITSLSVASGTPGTMVAITGTDFSDRESDHVVRFGDAVATIVDPSDPVPNVITVFIPDVAAGIHDITVTLGNTSNGFPFEVKAKPVAVKNVYLAARIGGSDGEKWKIVKSTFEPPSLSVTYEGGGADIGSLAADFVNNKIYMYVSSAPAVLARSNLNNTGYQELYTEAELGSLADFTLDIPRAKIYWTTIEAKVMKGNLDGSGTPELLYNYEDGNVGYIVYGISYHQPDDMLYLIEYNADTFLPGISKIKADGTGTPVSLFTDEDGLVDPRDVRIDSQHGKLFIVDGTTIFSGNADGSGTLNSFIAFQPGYQLIGMALDIQDQYVYWGEFDGGVTTHVYRKRYDGDVIPGTNPVSNVQEVYTITGSFISRDAPTGLVIEESTGFGGNQRMRFSALSLKTRSWRKPLKR